MLCRVYYGVLLYIFKRGWGEGVIYEHTYVPEIFGYVFG